MRGSQSGAMITVLFVIIIVGVVFTVGAVARYSFDTPAMSSAQPPTVASASGRR